MLVTLTSPQEGGSALQAQASMGEGRGQEQQHRCAHTRSYTHSHTLSYTPTLSFCEQDERHANAEIGLNDLG